MGDGSLKALSLTNQLFLQFYDQPFRNSKSSNHSDASSKTSRREMIGNEFPVQRKQREKKVEEFDENGTKNYYYYILELNFHGFYPFFFLLNSREIKVHCWRRTQLRQTRKKGVVEKIKPFLSKYIRSFSPQRFLSLSLSLFPFSLLPMELFHGSLSVSLFFLLSLSMKKPV